MSVEELVKLLRNQAHFMQVDGFAALLETGAQAADKLEELAAWNARLDTDLVTWTSKCFDAEAALVEAKRENEALRGERDFLQEILDARPAINAALPESYIRWSQSLYSGEVARASLSARNAGGKYAE